MDMFEFESVINFESIEGEEAKSTKTGILFSAGKHRNVDYTVEDLHTLAKSFTSDDPTPIQIDHSSSAKDTVGFVRNVWVDGNNLMGELDIVDSKWRERVEQKLNQKLSVSFYQKGQRPTRLREVSIVAFPQLKGAKMFKEDGGVKEMEEEKLVEMRKEIEKEYLAKFEEMQEQLTKFAEKELEAKAQAIVTEFSEKVIPAQEESMKVLVKSFSDEQLEAFKAFLEAGTQIDLQEKGGQEGKVEMSADEKAEADYKAWKEMMEQGGE